MFWVGAVVMFVAFVLSFFLKAAPLREKSAIQESLAESAEQKAQEQLEEEARLAADLTGAPIVANLDTESSTEDADDREPARR